MISAEPTLGSTRRNYRRIRPRSLTRIIAPLLLLVTAALGCHPKTQLPGTVVLVSIDTLRVDHVSVYGYPLPTTPSLEAIAVDSVIYDQGIAVHTNTAPSHASMLTGLYPPAHGSINNGVSISEQVPTLGQILSDHGFATSAFVSGKTLWAKNCGLDRGFELYEDRFEKYERKAEATLKLADRWLRRQSPDQPVFLFFHLYDPHYKYNPPEGFFSFGRDEHAKPVKPVDAKKLRRTIERDTDEWHQSVTEWTRLYDAEIAYADHAVGELMNTLRAMGRYSSALIIVVSDHGETLLERFRVFDHGGRVTEEQIRVPLIVKFPDSELAGTRVSRQVSHVDIVPTILQSLDLPPLPSMHGLDLRALATDSRSGERPVFCMARRAPVRLTELGFDVPKPGRWDGPETMLTAVRLPPHKLVDYAFLNPPDLRRLRNLRDDPGERSFFTDPAVQSRLEKLLDDWWVGTWSEKGDSEPLTLDDETTTMLKALGYMEPSAEDPVPTDPDDDHPAVPTNGSGNGNTQ